MAMKRRSYRAVEEQHNRGIDEQKLLAFYEKILMVF